MMGPNTPGALLSIQTPDGTVGAQLLEDGQTIATWVPGAGIPEAKDLGQMLLAAMVEWHAVELELAKTKQELAKALALLSVQLLPRAQRNPRLVQ